MWRFAILALVACTEHGQTPPGGDTPEPSPFETARFQPQVCTSGEPDAPGAPNPSCLVNQIPLEVVPGAEVRFTVQALGSGLVFAAFTFAAGPDGLVIDHAKIAISGGDTEIATEVELAAGETLTLPTFTIVGAQVISGMSLKFDSIGPQP